MPSQELLHVGMATLSPLRVAHRLCVFPASSRAFRNKISRTFQSLREWVVGFGLDPDTLLHIGIPTTDDQGLTTYDCCIEFPLPIDDEGESIRQASLPGGRYAVLRVEKTPAKIAGAIRRLREDYIPANCIVTDPERPIYEIYYKDTMEYCLPILE